MINLTDDVKQLLKNGLKEYCDDKKICLRLMEPDGERVMLMLDVKKDDDVVVENDGTALLVIERAIASSLDGVTLCIRDNGHGPTLVLDRRVPVLI